MTPEQIEENVLTVKAEIARAAAEAGRDPAEILLAAATKMNDAASVQAAIRAGVDICGENRVQEMLEKSALGAYEGAPLHFIGHLQKNKVRQVVGRCALIHSVDSLPLLQEISRTAEKPSSSGIIRSRSTRLSVFRLSLIICSASCPFSAYRTSYPASRAVSRSVSCAVSRAVSLAVSLAVSRDLRDLRICPMISRLINSSSTTKI